MYLVNTFLAKQTIYNMLNNMINNNLDEGRNIIHFSHELHDKFYEMLTAERLIRRVIKGQIVEEFVKPNNSVRNEALDCFVYLYTCAYSMGIKNLYGSEYQKLYQSNVLNKVNKPANPQNNQSNTTKRRNQGGWINRNGFSIT